MGAGALLTAAALPFTRVLADQLASLIKPVAVYPALGYEFKEALPFIHDEWGNLEDFYQAYFDDMTGSLASDTYGLALANQVIGLVRNDPAYIVRAGSLFAMHRDATKNAKEKHLADFGVKYDQYLLTGKYPKAAVETKGATNPVREGSGADRRFSQDHPRTVGHSREQERADQNAGGSCDA